MQHSLRAVSTTRLDSSTTLCIILLLLLATLTHAAMSMATKPGEKASELMAKLKHYEVVAINSDALHSQHPQSIAAHGQPSSNTQFVRTFSNRVSLSFESLKHGTHSMSAASGDDAANTDAVQPKQFQLELSKMDDLFHPDYSQTGQVWREGVRRVDLESVTPLEKIEQCYYRAHEYTAEHYLSLNTCFGGFSGFVKQDGTVWLLEPAHLHLPQSELHAHLEAFQQKHTDSFDDSSALGAEPLHASHLHLLFRADDVQTGMDEVMCTVGMTQSQRAEAARTGKLPENSPADSHAAHTHSHAHASNVYSVDSFTSPKIPSQAYSTWLAADAAHREYAESTASMEAEEAKEHRLAFEKLPEHVQAFRRRMGLSATTTSLKYVELLVTNDNARYKLVADKTEQTTASIVASIKATYEATTDFKPSVTVVLIGQITWLDQDPYVTTRGVCSACQTNNGASVDELLKNWNSWRSNIANIQPYIHDNGHLFSGMTFEVPTLGYAGVGAMCTNSISGGVESILGPTDFYNAIIASHEMGHNFGMNHDSTGNACAQSGFIMNAVLKAPTPTVFSTCSITYQVNWMASTRPTCLDNIPTKQYGTTADCGNGFIEAGEQCDCGNKISCQTAKSRDPCCNATSCSFIPGATCSATSGCCDNNCKVVAASANQVCRPAANTCDLPEICPGPSAKSDGSACPTDVGFAAGTSCSAGQYGPGLCYLNQCFSYLQQCRTAGANFPGAPFDTCTQQADLNQGNYCGTLWCSSTPGQCTYFKQSGNIIAISDGAPCPDGDGDLLWQCKNQVCVNPNDLNVNYYWAFTGFSDCSSCSEMQYQNVTCIDKLANVTVNSQLCSPSMMPATSQLCYNPIIGCYGAQADSSDVVDLFGYAQFSRKMLIFSTLGCLAGFLIIMGCCYQGVTFQGEGEELPGPSEGNELHREQQEAGLLSSSQVAPGSGTNSGKSSKKKKKKNPEQF